MAAAAAAPECPARNAIRATWTTRHGRQQARISNSTKWGGGISEPCWAREFDDPIALPDVGNYIIGLPEHVHTTAEWQAAMEALILVAELGGPTMFTRIGVTKALNLRAERVFNPDRKDHH